MDVHIRDATIDDLAAINAIYNHYVRESTSTFAIQECSEEDRLRWWREHAGRFAVVVAVRADEIVGWASLSAYSGRCGYRRTVENSVYLRPDERGRGLGRRLLSELVGRARRSDMHSIVAIISAEQPVSIRLHASAGYQEVGRLREAGFKFGRWIDVVFMQRMLNGADRAGEG